MLSALTLDAAAGAWRPGWLAFRPIDQTAPNGARPWRATIMALVAWGAIWAAPLATIWLPLGPGHVLWDIGVFFSKLAVVTSGGAYAVLAYMAQEAVSGYGWLGAGEMADGLGLAETTPGPLILVTQFVGYLTAFRAPEPFSPIVAGILGAALPTWVTFAPCFMWIFALAPWMERLQRAPTMKGALAGVTACVVGVIANLALWFALHVLFGRFWLAEYGPIHLQIPDWASFDWQTALIAAAAFTMIFVLKRGIMLTLVVAASLGFLAGL